jgi:osmotically-inducible protein OsmY
MYALTVHNNPVVFQGIAAAATECLQNSPYQAVRGVLCECDHGVLFLRGRLSSFHQKQVAQEAVARVKGVTQVINEIEVG